MADIKRYVPSYTILVWNSLFEISRLCIEDPIKAYDTLLMVIPLLPNKVVEEVEPKVRLFEARLNNIRNVVEREYGMDSITTKIIFNSYVKKMMKRFVKHALKLISKKMEEMRLKYQTELIEIGGERGE